MKHHHSDYHPALLNAFQPLKNLDPHLREERVHKKRRVKSSNSIGHPILTALLLTLMVFTPPAHAVGLEKAKGVLEIIKTEILGIVPIIAVIALIGLGIGYAMNSVNKETFIRWAVGLIIIGSAAQITSMLLG